MTEISPIAGPPHALDSHSSGRSTQRLAEFVGSLTGHDDHETTVRIAAEGVAEATGSEVSAILDSSGAISASVGLAPDDPPLARLLAISEGRRETLPVPGIGECRAIAIPIEADGLAYLVLARLGTAFSRDESNLLRAATRVLTMTLRTIRTLAAERAQREETECRRIENERLLGSLRERQKLFERLSRIPARSSAVWPSTTSSMGSSEAPPSCSATKPSRCG